VRPGILREFPCVFGRQNCIRSMRDLLSHHATHPRRNFCRHAGTIASTAVLVLRSRTRKGTIAHVEKPLDDLPGSCRRDCDRDIGRDRTSRRCDDDGAAGRPCCRG
jgi:hypothetical protein